MKGFELLKKNTLPFEFVIIRALPDLEVNFFNFQLL